MCVSAGASFGLAAVLAPVGLYCMTVAARRDRTATPIAAVPLLFGLQQACEGWVWLGIERNDELLTRYAGLAYLFFALAFWLVWIPFCAAMHEPRRTVRWLLAGDAVLGLLVGAALFGPIAMNPAGLEPTVVHHSIAYQFNAPTIARAVPQLVWHGLYLAIISAALILPRNKKVIWFGAGIVASAVLSHFAFWYAFASIWCFFAAILSLYLAYMFHQWPTSHGDRPATPWKGSAGLVDVARNGAKG